MLQKIFSKPILFFLLFICVFETKAQVLRSGEGIRMLGNAPLVSPGITTFPMGAAYVYNGASQDLFVSSDSRYPGIYLYKWLKNDASGIPVFAEGIKLNVPKNISTVNTVSIVQAGKDTPVMVYWLKGDSVIETKFDKTGLAFSILRKFKIINTPRNPRSIAVKTNADLSTSIYIEVGDGMPSNGPVHWKNQIFSPYSPEGFWVGNLSYSGVYHGLIAKGQDGGLIPAQQATTDLRQSIYGYQKLEIVKQDGNKYALLGGSTMGIFYYYGIKNAPIAPIHRKITFRTSAGGFVRLLPDGSLPQLPSALSSSNGNTFAGWYLDKNYKTAFDFNKPIRTDVEVYAKWIKDTDLNGKSHLISFQTNGGTPVADVQLAEGLVLIPTVSSHPGFLFKGWFSNPEFTLPFDLNTPVTQNVKLYASWGAYNYIARELIGYYNTPKVESVISAKLLNDGLKPSPLKLGSGITPTKSITTTALSFKFKHAEITKQQALANNQYLEFSIEPKKGMITDLASLHATLRTTGKDTLEYRWAYRMNDEPAFSMLGNADQKIIPNTKNDISAPISLSAIAEMQRILEGSKIIFRLYVWGTRALNGFSLDKPVDVKSPVLFIRGKIQPETSPLTERYDVVGPDQVILRHPSISARPIAYKNGINADNFIAAGEGMFYFYKFSKVDTLTKKVIFDSPKLVLQDKPFLRSGSLTIPNLVDWDGDGKTDMITGTSEGFIMFFKNEGTNEQPSFADGKQVTANGKAIQVQGNYRGSIQGSYEARWGYTNPAVVDWNNDGLPDIVMNDILSEHTVYLNRGSKTAPDLDERRYLYLDGITLWGTWRTKPAAGKLGNNTAYITLDEDDELHLYNRIDNYNLKDGGKIPLATGADIMANPWKGGGTGRAKFVLTDWDADGITDIIVGTNRHTSIPDLDHGLPNSLDKLGGMVLFMKNVGTNENMVLDYPKPLKRNGQILRFGEHDCSPAVGDIGKGKSNLIVGTEIGKIYFFLKEELTW